MHVVQEKSSEGVVSREYNVFAECAARSRNDSKIHDTQMFGKIVRHVKTNLTFDS